MVDILGIGAAGLSAYRKLLETVGGNITNASTDGYVRRDVKLSVTGDSNMLPTAAPQANGAGVVVDMVGRASDVFLQTQSLKANSLNMQSQTYADSLTQLEKSLFGTSNNPGSVVQDFFNRFNDVANAPTSTAARISVIDAGKQVADMFSQTSSSIQDSLATARSGLDAALTELNGFTSQLDRLNVQIQSATSSGQKPNDLLDQRDKILNGMSDLANFSFTELASGAVTVYLGDTASGRPLVGPDGAHQLGVIDTGGKLEVAMDPYTAPSITNQLTSGTVAGLLDFRAQAQSVMNDINRLAVGFSVAVNGQHVQGVDLNGQLGKPLFSTDGLTASPTKTNLGDAKVLLSINEAASLNATTYSVRYNAANDAWTIKSSDGKVVSGTNHVVVDGISFAFDGKARDGDSFTVSPLLGAAASMRFLPKSPAEIAVSLPLYVDPASTNAGNAELSPLKRVAADPAAPQPDAASLFNSANSINDFIRNGSAFVVPAGASSASIASLGAISAIHFNVSGSEIASLATPPDPTDRNSVASITLSLRLDAGLLDQSDINLSLKPQGSGLNDIAAAINTAAADPSLNGAQNKLFASVTNGVLSINALGAYTVSHGAISGYKAGFNANPVATSIHAIDEAGARAADIQIFTREGRQLSGPPLTDIQARALLTTANGFLPEAVYMPPSATSAYPGIGLEHSNSLLQVSTATAGSTIDVSSQPQFDMPQAGGNSPTISGAVYAMNVDGLDPVRLAGDALTGNDPAGIAAGLVAQMNAQASAYSWVGATIQPRAILKDSVAFNINIDGVDHRVVFHRALDSNGKPLNTGTFDLNGDTDLQVSLVPVSSSASATSLLSVAKPTLLVTGSQIGDQLLTLDQPSGSLAGVTWNTVGGKLQLSSTDPTMRVDTSTAAKKAMANALGFTGSEQAGLTIGATLDLASSLASSPSDPSRVMVTIPQSLRTTTPQITISPISPSTTSDLTAIGLGTALTENITGSGKIPSSRLTAPPAITLKLTGPNGDVLVPVTGLNGSGTGLASGVSWSYNADTSKLTISTATPGWRLKADTIATRNAAVSLGFLGADLTVDIQNTVAAANDLTPAFLTSIKPTLHVSGDQIGSQVLVVDQPNGMLNGVTWSTVGGKLQLSSADPTMRIDAGTAPTMAMARALGFTGLEQAGRSIAASQDLASSLVAAQELTISISDDAGTRNLTIGSLEGTDQASGISWSYVGKRLVLSGPNANLQINTGSNDTGAAARAFGFLGVDQDRQVDGARINLSSTVTDRGSLVPLVDTSSTVSRVGSALTITRAIPEDLIVAVVNQDTTGLRRIAADVQMNPTPPSPLGQDLQVKILDNGTLEIFDPTTGQSLANRTWEQDTAVNYRGISFIIHGAPKIGDIFTIRNDLTRSSDNRNALQMANLALTQIFGENQGTYQDVYAGVTSKLGSSVQASNNIAGAAAQAASDLKSAYESKTGVNLDQEAADLIRYQQAYQAAAQVVMAARDMFATILKSF